MAKDKTMMWVYPSYKSKVKADAAAKGISILDYTQLLSEGKVTKKKKLDFNFGILK